MVVTRQRYDKDCGLGALASLTGIPYEDVYVEAAKIDRARGKDGLFNYQVLAIARRLHWRLRPTTAFNLDRDEGILRVFFYGPKAATSPGGHFVALKQEADEFGVVRGTLGCPQDGCSGPWHEWLTANHADPGTLLRVTRKPR
jgi:hypothetical protein